MNLIEMFEHALAPLPEIACEPLRLLFLVSFDRLKAAEIGNPLIHHLVVLRHAVVLALAEGLDPLVLGGAAETHDLAAVEKVRTADVAAQTDPAEKRRLEAHRIRCRILHMREGAAAGHRLMSYVNELAGRDLFSPDVVERVYRINICHDDPTIGIPLGDGPEYHAFRAADRCWQLAEGFAVDLERDRRHSKNARLGLRDLAEGRLADVRRSYAKERQLYPADDRRFLGETMFRSAAAFGLYERLARERVAEYGL